MCIYIYIPVILNWPIYFLIFTMIHKVHTYIDEQKKNKKTPPPDMNRYNSTFYLHFANSFSCKPGVYISAYNALTNIVSLVLT